MAKDPPAPLPPAVVERSRRIRGSSGVRRTATTRSPLSIVSSPTARELHAFALDNARLIDPVREQFGLAVVDAIVPTEQVLAARPER